MLVLKRHWNQRIILSNGVTITLVRSDSSSARIGIDAPEDVEILREELVGTETREAGGF